MPVIKLKMSLTEKLISSSCLFQGISFTLVDCIFSVPEEVVLRAQLRATHAEGERLPQKDPRHLELP